jgi:hypothetical protein
LVKWLHKQFSGIYIKRNKILGCLLGVLKGTMNKQSKAVHFRLIGDMDGFFFVKKYYSWITIEHSSEIQHSNKGKK